MNMRDLDLQIMFDSLFHKCKSEEETEELMEELIEHVEYAKERMDEILWKEAGCPDD